MKDQSAADSAKHKERVYSMQKILGGGGGQCKI